MSDSETPDRANLSSVDERGTRAGGEPPELAPPEPRFACGDPIPHREMWILERRLGGGGFGEVWLARHEYQNVPPVAVKFCTHANRHLLVMHEKKVIVRVMKHGGDHPNVVPLLDCNLSGDTPWLIYEYVPGGTLADSFEEFRALPPPDRVARAARTLHPIAGALARFHQFDPPIVHRDMKPHNVLMAGTTPRITDFGIGGLALASADVTFSVRLPTLLKAAGTLRYSSPEQLFGSPTHPRDDVFALGVIAYQLLTADLAATPGSDAADELRELGVPPEFVSLVTKSVATNPDRRPKDAGEWAAALAAWVPADVAAPAAPAPMPPPARRKVHVPLAGEWSSRPADADGKRWSVVTRTPATVLVAAGEVYSLRVHSTATDRELEAVKTLTDLISLQALDLSWCEHVTDAGLAHVAALVRLESLDLSGCSQLTDAGLAHVTALANLRQLDLSCCPRVTDAGLARLTALTGLRHLSLLICDQLSDAGVAAFQEALPDCVIRC